MLNRCAWYMYGREMVLNRLTLILVCPCTGHPPIRPMYTVSRSFSYSTPNVFRHISSASRLLVRVTIASASTWARYKLHFWVFLFGTQVRSLPCLVQHAHIFADVENDVVGVIDNSFWDGWQLGNSFFIAGQQIYLNCFLTASKRNLGDSLL